MGSDCKSYIADEFPDLPMAAFSVHTGYGGNGRYTAPVRSNWDEPRVEESGNCIVVDGRVMDYVRTSD